MDVHSQKTLETTCSAVRCIFLHLAEAAVGCAGYTHTFDSCLLTLGNLKAVGEPGLLQQQEAALGSEPWALVPLLL